MKRASVFVHRYSKGNVFGGVERVVEKITQMIKNIKWSIYCWNLYGENRYEKVSNNVEIWRLNFYKNELLKLLEIRKIFVKPSEFIWIQDIIPAFRAMISKMLKNRRLYLTLHASHLHFIEVKTKRRWILRRVLERNILRGWGIKIEKISAVSRFLVEFYSRMGSRNIFYTPNGIDFPKLSKYFSNYKQSYIVFVGTLCERKGAKELLRAFKASKENLYLIGEVSPEIKELLSRSVRLKNIKYIGYVSEKEKMNMLSHAKALILPSYDEGFGLTVLEALSVGTPIIATPVGIVPELFELGDVGVMLKSNPPDVNEIIRAVKGIGEYDSRKLQKIAKKYDWKRVIKYWKVFLE